MLKIYHQSHEIRYPTLASPNNNKNYPRINKRHSYVGIGIIFLREDKYLSTLNCWAKPGYKT